MDAKIFRCVLLLIAMTLSSTDAQCQGLAQDEYQTTGADVVIGVMQDFYGNSDGAVCSDLDDDNRVLYDAAKLALGALPSGMTSPTFGIGKSKDRWGRFGISCSALPPVRF